MEKLYTPEDVAEKYGVKVATVWSWIREGKLKAFRIGRLYRVYPDDLSAFEKSNTNEQK